MHQTSTPIIFTPILTTLVTIELSVWINRLKQLIFESMKKAQSDNTHLFWSTHKQTSNFIACKPYCALYTKEFLTWKTMIHIHAENSPLVNNFTHHSPSLPSMVLYHCKLPCDLTGK